MRIKNTAVKVIGVAGIDLNPGSDWVEVANEKVYVPVFNERGVKTDKLQVLPALQLLKRMGQIDYLEDEKPMVESSDFLVAISNWKSTLALMICHKMKMAGHGENSLGELGKIGNTFAASSVSDGGSSISFASSGAGNLQTDAEYGLTIYGAQYLQLRKMVIMGIRVSGEGDFRGRL